MSKKVTWDKVHKIREALNDPDLTYLEASKQFGIDDTTISRIYNNRTWHDPKHKPVPRSKHTNKGYTWEQVNAFRAEVNEGISSICATAVKHGITPKYGYILYYNESPKWFDPDYIPSNELKERPQVGKIKFRCPCCGMGVHARDKKSPLYGKPFETEEEADQCCKGSGTPSGKTRRRRQKRTNYHASMARWDRA